METDSCWAATFSGDLGLSSVVNMVHTISSEPMVNNVQATDITRLPYDRDRLTAGETDAIDPVLDDELCDPD
ncbi:MAG: hypothetical protein Phyf2KO_04140 [Phycisphaerales bacterium]